ncbi:MAG TPA: sulfite exporter TauE/SafE family protein [Micromonospora sp.]
MNLNLTLVGLAIIAIVGSVIQRTTGIGFALIVSPCYSILLGPVQGVILSNLTSLGINLAILALTWRDVDWKRLPYLVVPGVLAVIPGGWIALTLPSPFLSIVVGAAVLVAAVLAMRRPAIPALAGRWGIIGAGASSGFMNAIAGVGGPPIAIYAATTNWSIASFIPTSQVTYISVNFTSLLVKGWPSAGWTELSAAVVGVGIGALLGAIVANKIPEKQCFVLALVVAAIGGTAGIVRGVVSL